MTKSLLLISDQPEDVSFVAEVCQFNQASLQVMPDPKKAVEYLAAHSPIAIFINVDNLKVLHEFEMEAQQRFGLFSDQVQPYKFHFISGLALGENRDVTKSPFFGSYFERPIEEVEEKARFYGRFVDASEKRVTHELSHFLSEKGKVQTLTLTHSDQKQEAAEAVRQYLIQAKVPARISNIIANAVDELLMNAIFDAPADEFGRPIYTSTVRSQSRPLLGQEEVMMKIGFDGFYVGVSITDHFGLLDRGRLLNHVSMNYREQEYTVKQGNAGAGLGLASVFKSGGSLIYHCETGSKTEATLLYRAFSNYRDFKNQFHFFSAKFYV